MPVRRGHKATAVALLLALIGPVGQTWPATGASPPQTPPQSLQAALKALQVSGLKLVFSNALVKPHYRVSAGVGRADSLAGQAALLLQPFGLGLERADAGVWYVVQAAVPEVQAPAPARVVPQPAIVEEVLVSSSRHRLVRESHERRGLDQRELEIVPSIGRDLLRAVNHLPGQASVGVSARSHMRGGNTDEVLYLVDGIQLIEPFHMADFHALFSAINPSLVDSINVYHAGFPAVFGSRLSGVVDMELAEAERPVEGRVNLDFVNAATQAQGYTGATHWLVSARRSTVDYLLDYAEQDYGRPKFHDELMRLSWQGEATDLTMGMLYGNDELTLADDNAGETARADYHNLATWLRSSHVLDEHLALQFSGSFTSIDNERQGRVNDPGDAVGSLEESRQFTVATFRSAVQWRPAKRWLIHAGAEGQQQNAEFEVDIESHYGQLGEPLQPVDLLLRRVSADRDGTLLTAFLSAQQQITDHLRVEYGARYDLQDIEPVRNSQFSPRVQITYDSGRSWRTFLNVGRYAQHQNLYELQLDDGLLELHDPQLADQVSIGTDWTAAERWRIGLEAYWREIDDPWSRFENLYNRWVLLPELHADRVNLLPQQARTFGAEVVLDHRPSEVLRWSLSLALARAEERFGDEWRPRPWEQRRTLRASMDWRPARWRIGVSAGYHTGWPTTSLVTEALSGANRLYDRTLPGYFSLDIHAARHVDLPRSELEIYFDLSNATFAANVGGYRYELSGTGFVRDQRMLLPPVPVLGLSWSW
jgi:outer membrane receptor protein involved in Fe transport